MVMEAHTAQELIAWTRAFGMEKLLRSLPETTQTAWAADLVKEAESHRKDGSVRLGGITRIVIATPTPSI